MRGRHNIVGTEVGRPKPPFYANSPMRLQITKPRSARRWIILSFMAASCLGLIFAAVG